MKTKIYTIGYTGFTIDAFLQAVSDAGVELLIDTRELPISRKPGFAKSRLSTALAERGISYVHFRGLGSPKLDRHELRATGDYEKFFRKVNHHLSTGQPAADLEQARALCREHTSCLMCCCPDWTHCHRRCLVEKLSTSRVLFEHLTAQATPVRRAA